jgi:D-alanyl-D-alanine carboxypeptidase
MKNFNPLLDRYPGADGMKTGFICASGFNIVATATRNGRRLIAVVLGAYSGHGRAEQAAQLLETGFNSGGLSWLTPSLGTVDELAPINAPPPDLRPEVCGGHRHKPPAEKAEEDDDTIANGDNGTKPAFMLSSLKPNAGKFVLGPPVDTTPPVVVFTGPPDHPDQVHSEKPHRAAHRAKTRKRSKAATAKK